ncbi:PcfJ domain-containing protein [Dysgonomonas sp. ZJ709]|uniref:PcfJ domain-containing protein n=1 Tax=Dysgonomonas sp. ZJ709 TaxID=2709797 RepID=UPI0013EB14F1|nr:PcfJ domain-containing protein [Dysgonomonas sp. ZJ709]
MKPKNKFQQQIVEASKTLPSITKEQIQWGYDNAISYVGQRTKKGKITCCKCSHSLQGMGELINTLLGCECPNCKSKLIVKTSQKRSFNDSYYMTVIDAHKGYQVVRTIMLSYTTKTSKLPEYTHSEVMQRWIAPNGKHCTFARLRQTMGTCYYDAWIFHTPLELRDENRNNKFCINVYDRINTGEIYPRQKLIPELKRTGYKNRFYRQKPLDLFRILLTDSRAETLIKAGYTKLIQRIMDSGWTLSIDNYWQSIRICIRNGYKIKDTIMWCDYVDMLRFFGKDLHNAKYVCPKDLKAEHDRYVIKKAKANARLEVEKQLEKEEEYRQAKEKFFGLMFSDGIISVRVLESVAEIIAEGKAMKHCVASYHSKADSLILTACIDGKKIETIELSLSQLRVIQSRGKCNKCTEYHSQIINLVESNISQIQERLAA